MKTITLLIFLIIPLSSHALTGSQAAPFLEDCTSGVTLQVARNDNSFMCGYVLGVARGIRDTPGVVESYIKDREKHEIIKPFCIPDEVTNHQLVRDLHGFIQRRPEAAHEEVYTLLIRAMVRKYPCE